MKVVCLSDLHGRLPDLRTEITSSYDLVVIGGDICPDFRNPADTSYRNLGQAQWLDSKFRNWLETIPAPVVGVAGNHDLIFQQAPHLVPQGLRWTYLEDAVAEVAGVSIFGSPWQKPFGVGWAFNLADGERARKWLAMPDKVDIVLLHGPPFGTGDLVRGEGHQGCPLLYERLKDVKTKLVVFGHIHEGYGTYERADGTKYVNAALHTRWMEPENEIQIVDI